MKGILINDIVKRDGFKRIITFIITFAFMLSVLSTSLAYKKYNLKEGDIAKINIKAPREIKDEISTEARVKEAMDAVPLQYNRKTEVKNDVINEINTLFTALVQFKEQSIDEKQKLDKLKLKILLNISNDDYLFLLKLNKDELTMYKEVLTKALTELYDNNNISDNGQKNNKEDIKKAQDNILIKINSSKLSETLKDSAVVVGFAEIRPNFFYDKTKTEELRNEAIKEVPPVMIKKDQTIVKEGEPATKLQLEILSSLGVLNASYKYQFYVFIALSILILLVLYLQWFYLYKFRNELFKDFRKLMMINILNCIAVISARTFSIVSPYLIPVACIPMVMTLLVDYKVSLVIGVLDSILISGAVQFNVDITLIAVLNAVIGAIILKKMNQRMDILHSSIFIAVINAILTLSIGFILSNSVIDISKRTIYAIIASFISGILTIGFLPVFESIFRIVTTIKLLELSNPNNPLLKRLLIEAPGSYHHSILVGNLAEVAAEEVNGNALLVRVSSYYHDIGKIKRPYFFKENQLGNDNPHNKITPNLSTLIITSHVKDGVELAREYKIPKIIIDIIEQHHGTTLVKYFYVTMKNNSDKPEEIKEEDFRYIGPIPETKEAGIIMLADCVEASVRSINDPTKGKIEEMVNNIIKDRLDEGQLDNCDLTLKDINKIKKAFLRILNGIYHNRIEYPTEKIDIKKISS